MRVHEQNRDLVDEGFDFGEVEGVEVPSIWEEVSAITFTDGFSMIRGTDYWIGSDSCEYDDPADYLNNGSPLRESETK